MTEFTVADYIVLIVLFLGGIALMRAGIKMLIAEDEETRRDTLCPPHAWEEKDTHLMCIRCGRTVKEVSAREPKLPPTWGL